MNRTWINFLSIIIIAIISVMVVVPCIGFSYGFISGLNETDVNESVLLTTSPISVALDNTPEQLIVPTDSIRTEEGRSYAFTATTGFIHIPDKNIPMWTQIAIAIGYTLALACYAFMLIYFVKFIININRGNVFVYINVRFLKRIAIGLLGMALMLTLSGIVEEMLVGYLPTVGIGLRANWSIPWTILLLGFLSLLMSQVWARGIELREDQEFTI
ncbi:MAG: DUF2975 domain-containing protein [Muribaculum sp.]|nr:DUF2975 domain-containing protein [Muribaculum sp.]